MEEKRLLLKVGELADAIGVSKATAYDLINRGAIRSVRLAGRGKRGLLRVPAAALRELTGESAAAPERPR